MLEDLASAVAFGLERGGEAPVFGRRADLARQGAARQRLGEARRVVVSISVKEAEAVLFSVSVKKVESV